MNKQTESEKTAVKQAQLFQQWAQELDSAAHWERTKLLAKSKRLEYMAFLAAGFTEQQALVLVKSN